MKNWQNGHYAENFSHDDESIIYINTPAEMARFAYLVTQGYAIEATCILEADLDMSAYDWTPIGRWSGGNSQGYFEGSFDGQGHTISGIRVPYSNIVTMYDVGLFDHLYGSVKNLKIANSQIAGSQSVGCIAAKMSQGNRIENCYIGSDVILSTTSDICGGIVGEIHDNSSVIKGCYSAASVSGRKYVGGIVGALREGKVIQNVSQATVSATGSNDEYGYVFADYNRHENSISDDNYYIATERSGNVRDTCAYHITLEESLKNLGYEIDYEGTSITEYDVSGLTFANNGNQFKMDGEWYATEHKPFYFKPTNRHAGAEMNTVTLTENSELRFLSLQEDGYYFFTTAHDAMVSGNMLLKLANNGNNHDLLETFNGKTLTVVLNDRTFYKDGSWNTLFLPFDLTAEQLAANDCPLKDATVKALSSSSFEDGTLTLNFYDYTQIYDGTPYIVKWAETGDPIEDPVFRNVTIENHPGQSTTDYVDLKGSFSPISLEANDHSVLYLGADNKLYYPSADMTVGSCRAYFKLKGITAGDAADGARAIVLNFGDEATGITLVNGSETRMSGSDAWYTIDGRRLNCKPTAKGLYIYNGKKVIK